MMGLPSSINKAIKVINNVISSQAGTVKIHNPRQELSGALTETSKVVSQIPSFASDARNMSNIATTALNQYDTSINWLTKP